MTASSTLRRSAAIPAALLVALAPAAQAQIPPLGRPELQRPVQRDLRPLAPIAALARPTLVVNGGGAVVTRKFGSLSVDMGGVPGATAYHLLAFDPGCEIDLQPKPGGFNAQREPLQRTRDSVLRESNRLKPRYTTDPRGEITGDNGFDPTVIRIADVDGVPVSGAGTARAIAVGSIGRWSNGAPRGFRQDPRVGVSNYNDWLSAPDPVTPGNSTCAAQGVVAWKAADGIWRVIDDATGRAAPVTDLSSPRRTQATWFLKETQQITIEETGKLEKWGLIGRMNGASIGAVCDGLSWGPAGDHRVGVGSKGGDITFTLRSGPVGNRCGFSLTPYLLPDGVTVQSRSFSIERVGDQCHLNPSATLPQDVMIAAMNGAWYFTNLTMAAIRWLVTGETSTVSNGMNLYRTDYVFRPTVLNSTGLKSGGSVSGWRNPYDFGDPVDYVTWLNLGSPMAGLLECNPALSNDNAATLRLDRVVLNVPVGQSLDL